MIENSENFAKTNNLITEQMDNVLKSLVVDEYVNLEVIERRVIELTGEGMSYASNGSPEFQFVSAMQMDEKVSMAEMEKRVGAPIAKIGQGKAMK